jgi:hypothetical protein
MSGKFVNLLPSSFVKAEFCINGGADPLVCCGTPSSRSFLANYAPRSPKSRPGGRLRTWGSAPPFMQTSGLEELSGIGLSTCPTKET